MVIVSHTIYHTLDAMRAKPITIHLINRLFKNHNMVRNSGVHEKDNNMKIIYYIDKYNKLYLQKCKKIM